MLWLVSGGIALGLALGKTGLAKLVVNSIPFDQYSPYAVLFGAAFPLFSRGQLYVAYGLTA
ncbi:hypothetical protein P4S64_12020 [Vibrio sp. M60_M31a]